MKIYPAIDILKGKCVRLTEGEKEKSTIYYESPVEAALLWKSKGAKQLHVIDLDGAFEGKPQNVDIISEIIRETQLPVQVGGGLRTIEAVELLVSAGADRIIVGTAAVMDEDFLELCVKSFRDKLVVSVDAKNGYVATEGWVNLSQVSAYNFARKLVEKGIKNLVYTDISRDGTLKGPDFDGMERMCSIEFSKIIASGGIKSIEDLRRLKSIGVEGAIIGKALYSGSLSLEAALEV